METKPHGWNITRTGRKLHYFGLSRDGKEAYRPDGTPLALCHNGLIADPDSSLRQDQQPGLDICDSCQSYVLIARKSWRIRESMTKPAQPSSKLGPGVAVVVSRGKWAGMSTEIVEAAKDFPGFWWVLGGERKLMFSEGQLQAKK